MRASFSGVWPPNWTITPSGLLLLADREHVLGGQRLEVEAVGGVVVGRDRLRVAVDHHRVAAELARGHRRVHAAVVELDPLADPVRAGAEDDDRVALAAADLGGGRACRRRAGARGRVVVGRRRLELGGAGVDRLVGADQALGAVALGRQRLAARAGTSGRPGRRSWTASTPMPRRKASRIRSKRSAQGFSSATSSSASLAGDVGLGVELARAHRLGEGLAEGAADRHRLADALHVGREAAVGAGELLEGEARDLGDDVVDRRLERGRRGPGDVVGDLLQRVADRQLRRHLRDREAGRLRGQRRGARDPRVHLDHDDLAVLGVDRELDVGAAGLDPDRPDHLDRLTSRSSW